MSSGKFRTLRELPQMVMSMPPPFRRHREGRCRAHSKCGLHRLLKFTGLFWIVSVPFSIQTTTSYLSRFIWKHLLLVFALFKWLLIGKNTRVNWCFMAHTTTSLGETIFRAWEATWYNDEMRPCFGIRNTWIWDLALWFTSYVFWDKLLRFSGAQVPCLKMG